jgi:hypothetical protein
MATTRDEALAALGLAATPDADAAAIQRAFERLARRYPEPHFPERFRQLLEARDLLLDAARKWREQLEGSTLDLTWMLPHLVKAESVPDRRAALQAFLRAGYLAEPLRLSALDDLQAALEADSPF